MALESEFQEMATSNLLKRVAKGKSTLTESVNDKLDSLHSMGQKELSNNPFNVERSRLRRKRKENNVTHFL